MKKIYTLLFLSIVFTLTGCIPQISIDEEPTLGALELDEFITLGDRYAAGLSNANRDPGGLQGLYEAGQLASFPALIAEQLNLLSIEERRDSFSFGQHLLEDQGSGFYMLQEITLRECDGRILEEKLSLEEALPNWLNQRPSERNFHNLGIPFLKVSQLFDSDALSLNPFFNVMQTQGDNFTSYTDLFADKNPSLAILWFGLEDLIIHAVRGGSNSAFPITSVDDFSQNFSRLLDSIESRGTEKFLGVIGNIPEPTLFPYFRAVPPVFSSSENCNANGSSVYYEDNKGDIRIADSEVSILLPVWERLGMNTSVGPAYGLTMDNPIPNTLVLDQMEMQRIKEATQKYNQAIDSLVERANAGMNRPRWIIADLNNAFSNLGRGFTEGGLEVSTTHLSGGIFSLDGLSLTPRGNAFVANEFMEAIDVKSRQGVNLNALKLADYPGVVYP
ncbi:MAG: hypothetical protein MRZ79_05420 [Bacteroidia bacterium]|nr:hypothetical protein [Bacteroidia bacterium]